MTDTDDLAIDGVAPEVELTETLLVEIHRPQPPGQRLRDDGTVLAFLEWLSSRHLYPVAGGSCGPGFYSGTFDIKHAPAIRRWFTERRTT